MINESRKYWIWFLTIPQYELKALDFHVLDDVDQTSSTHNINLVFKKDILFFDLYWCAYHNYLWKFQVPYRTVTICLRSRLPLGPSCETFWAKVRQTLTWTYTSALSFCLSVILLEIYQQLPHDQFVLERVKTT